MNLFRNLFKKDNEENEKNFFKQVSSPESGEANTEDEDEIISAITAAISCILQKNPSEFVVRNIARTCEIDSFWAAAGRMKLMR